MHVTFSFAFSSRYSKIRTSEFCKVVRQHTEGMIGSIIWILLEMYFSFQQWKNFKNPLRIDKVIATSLVYYFFGTQCMCTFCFVVFILDVKTYSKKHTNYILACSGLYKRLRTGRLYCRITSHPPYASPCVNEALLQVASVASFPSQLFKSK